jgi:23S rRNA (guanine745-N1)-methyltransferase
VRALRSAARAHDRAAAAAWDVFRPFPLADGAADVVLNVFAPRNPAEFHRVLRPTGRLIVVRPTGRHLGELRGLLPAMVTIDPAKEQRLHRALNPFFEAVTTERVEYPATLTELDAVDLVAMTPSARHVSRADLNDGGLPLPDRVTVSVLATAYRPR